MRSISNFATISASEMQQIEGGTYYTTPKPVVYKPIFVKPPVAVICHPAPTTKPPVYVAHKPSHHGHNSGHGKSKSGNSGKGSGKC
jgi:hypothetical protein